MPTIFKRKIIKTYYTFANPIKKIYRFIFRPNRRGAKCIVECDGKILLTRIDYAHRNWVIPGGGVKRKESFEDGAKRELFEETGIKVDKVEYLGEYTNYINYSKNFVQFFYVKTDDPSFKIDGIEIAEAGWFDPLDLPKNRSKNMDIVVGMFLKRNRN